jgi:hypothetical protein
MPSGIRRSGLVLLGFVVTGTIGAAYGIVTSTLTIQYGRALFVVLVCQPSVAALVCGWYRLGLRTVVVASLIPPVVGNTTFRILVPYPGSYGSEQLLEDVALMAVASLVILVITTCVYALGRTARTVTKSSASGD